MGTPLPAPWPEKRTHANTTSPLAPRLERLDPQVGVGVEPGRELRAHRLDAAVHGAVGILRGRVVLAVLVPEGELRHALARVEAVIAVHHERREVRVHGRQY